MDLSGGQQFLRSRRASRPVRAIALGLALAVGLLAACGGRDTHPLKGVIVEVYGNPPGLLVNHETVPGVMQAMTMRFEVEAATVATVRPGEAITAGLRFHDGKWRLEDVRVVQP